MCDTIPARWAGLRKHRPFGPKRTVTARPCGLTTSTTRRARVACRRIARAACLGLMQRFDVAFSITSTWAFPPLTPALSPLREEGDGSASRFYGGASSFTTVVLPRCAPGKIPHRSALDFGWMRPHGLIRPDETKKHQSRPLPSPADASTRQIHLDGISGNV